ncbi:hypothetical protein [Faecalibacterium hattorii]|jgi:hypothetical protein|uniref:hypothetical protein n=1 Tax=Faecalibacterium hattorii TaxID=2935520 RepID=UPI002056C882|nr:MAG TPA: hypothetical protein [Caudoviricetes sp.]DAJ03978.1 MAG TPA: hypothetical protein [Caudoviricetes sp.]DAL14689.1 MAG TPA_asm: hypothetical protein [Caudoviricetes sp.]DAX03449.1 MAG TPA: hypothetical protein [Bacteriophage sp.]
MAAKKENNGEGEMVSIRLFSDNGRYKGDLFVSVNGVNYQIKRGVTVQVPPEVAEVIQHSEEQDAQSAARMEAIIARGE